MQLLNKFAYRVLVSRVQTAIPVGFHGQLYSLGGCDCKCYTDQIHSLFVYDEYSEVCREFKYDNIYFTDYAIIQAEKDVYAFPYNQPDKFFKIKVNNRSAKMKNLQGLVP